MSSFTFVNLASINERHFACSICKEILDDPKQCNRCHKAFCSKCNKTAPLNCHHCKQSIDDSTFHRGLRIEWDEIKIRCDTCNEECQRGSWEAHRDKYCKVECLHCKMKVEKQSVVKHEKEECEESIVRCPGQEEVERLGVTDIECPHQIARKELKRHQCDLTKVLPVLKKMKHSNDLVVYNIKVGDKIDFRDNANASWYASEITAIDDKVITIGDKKQIVRSNLFIAPLGTYTSVSSSSSQYNILVHRSTLRPGMVCCVPGDRMDRFLTVVKAESSKIYCAYWNVGKLVICTLTRDLVIRTDPETLPLIHDFASWKVRKGMLVRSGSMNRKVLITRKIDEVLHYHIFDENKNLLESEISVHVDLVPTFSPWRE